MAAPSTPPRNELVRAARADRLRSYGGDATNFSNRDYRSRFGAPEDEEVMLGMRRVVDARRIPHPDRLQELAEMGAEEDIASMLVFDALEPAPEDDASVHEVPQERMSDDENAERRHEASEQLLIRADGPAGSVFSDDDSSMEGGEEED